MGWLDDGWELSSSETLPMEWMSSTVPHFLAGHCKYNAGGMCTHPNVKPNTYVICFGPCPDITIDEYS